MSIPIPPPVLMYHSVTPRRPGMGLWTVSLERFDQQMRWLHQRGRRGVAIRELLGADRDEARGTLVGLTFDDGYADFAEHVLPVLQRYGFSATAFVVAGRLGNESAWVEGHHQALLTAGQIRQVAAAGVEIGSHGLSHRSLISVPDAELAGEIKESRRILQEISGQDVPGFSYPYGDHDDRVVSGVQAAGYDYSCAVGYSPHTGRLALPRIYVGEGDSPNRLWAKGLQYWLRWDYGGPGSRLVGSSSRLLQRVRGPAS